MAKYDTIYKIMFAIGLALLPLMFCAYIYMPAWTVGLFIAGIFLTRIWMEIFKTRTSLTHNIVGAISSVIVFTTILIFFINVGYISAALGVISIILILLSNLFNLVVFNKKMSETMQAVDFCNMLFECLTLLAFAFASINTMPTRIGLYAIVLTAAVIFAYKLYYSIRYTDFYKNLFRKRK